MASDKGLVHLLRLIQFHFNKGPDRPRVDDPVRLRAARTNDRKQNSAVPPNARRLSPRAVQRRYRNRPRNCASTLKSLKVNRGDSLAAASALSIDNVMPCANSATLSRGAWRAKRMRRATFGAASLAGQTARRVRGRKLTVIGD